MTRPLLLVLAVIALALLIAPPFLSLGWQNALIGMLIASLFAASFNLLIGYGGMLSFGHAAFFGVGAFATVHLMRLTEAGLAFPTVLLPLAGGLGGLAFGIVAGWFATIRSGVYFALITLAIAEMLHSLAPHLAATFGGESGISSMRMPWAGFAFGRLIEVYYLVLAWVTACLLLLYGLTHTPFGRVTLGLRENEQRLRFLGYNVHRTKVMVFAVSALFSGIAGGLLVISNEVVNYSLFSTHVSAQVVLHTFIGGAGMFLGPVFGASLMSFFAYVVSDLTRSWLLYQGLLFVLVMLFVPHGLAGLIAAHWHQARRLDWRALAVPYAAAFAGGLLVVAGTAFTVECLEVVLSPRYKAAARAAGVLPAFEAFGMSLQPLSPLTWLPALLAVAFGVWLMLRTRRPIAAVWARIGNKDADLAEEREQ
jgi:branched-chain amino acid transport system permease protein